jgi:hypothetical protein
MCKLSEELNLNSISLKEIGLCEKAWQKDDAIQVVEYLYNNRYPILGGDVYEYEDIENSICSTYDSWYTNESDFKTAQEFLLKSKDIAINYIINYSNKNGNKYCYSIVCGNKL